MNNVREKKINDAGNKLAPPLAELMKILFNKETYSKAIAGNMFIIFSTRERSKRFRISVTCLRDLEMILKKLARRLVGHQFIILLLQLMAQLRERNSKPMTKRELSSTLKNLKFMQRASLREEKTKEEHVTPDENFPSSSTPWKW
ncbi:hypothetical protein LguiA_011839 [Lonicera macranthoides]